MGLPRYAIEEVPQLDGSVRRTGSVHRFGLTLTWEEGVPEWVAPRRFLHERRFHAGPLRRAATEITIEPIGDSEQGADGAPASRVRYRLQLDPRSWIVALGLRLGVVRRFGRVLDRLFREAAEFAIQGRDQGLWAPPVSLSKTVQRRIRTRAEAVAEQGYGAADRLAEHLLAAPNSELERMRPRALARQWGI